MVSTGRDFEQRRTRSCGLVSRSAALHFIFHAYIFPAFLLGLLTEETELALDAARDSLKGLVTHQIPSTHAVPLSLQQEINSLSRHQSQKLAVLVRGCRLSGGTVA